MYNGFERVIQAETQLRQGVACLFSLDSRAACSFQSMPAPDLQGYVSRKPGEFLSMQPKWPVISAPCWPSQELMGVEGVILHQALSTGSLAPPIGLTPRAGCAP